MEELGSGLKEEGRGVGTTCKATAIVQALRKRVGKKVWRKGRDAKWAGLEE